MTGRLTVTVPGEVLGELNQYAEELGEKKSHIVAEALERYFDFLDLRLAEQRAKEVREGKENAVPWEEVKKELGL